jgi:hypothetical protein
MTTSKATVTSIAVSVVSFIATVATISSYLYAVAANFTSCMVVVRCDSTVLLLATIIGVIVIANNTRTVYAFTINRAAASPVLSMNNVRTMTSEVRHIIFSSISRDL